MHTWSVSSLLCAVLTLCLAVWCPAVMVSCRIVLCHVVVWLYGAVHAQITTVPCPCPCRRGSRDQTQRVSFILLRCPWMATDVHGRWGGE